MRSEQSEHLDPKHIIINQVLLVSRKADMDLIRLHLGNNSDFTVINTAGVFVLDHSFWWGMRHSFPALAQGMFWRRSSVPG